MFHWIRNGRTDPDVESLKEFEKKAFGDMGNIGDRTVLSFNPFSLPAYAKKAKKDLRLIGIFSGNVGDDSDPRNSLIEPNRPPTQEDIAAFMNISNFRDLDETSAG